MSFVDTARAIVCNVIAVALAMSVSAVATLLPNRPDWLERVDALALQLKAIYEKDRAFPSPAAETEPSGDAGSPPVASGESPGVRPQPDGETARLLAAYDRLWQFVHGIRSEGLLLDDRFCERVEREWTVKTLMSYMRSADLSLQDRAGETLDEAAACLSAPGSKRDRSV